MTAAAFSLTFADNHDRYFALTDEQREVFHGWFRLHGVDERDVPLSAVVEFDEDTREWRIPVFLRRDGMFYVRDDGEVAQAVVRRAWKADAPVLEPDADALARVKAERAEYQRQAAEADARLAELQQQLADVPVDVLAGLPDEEG